MASEQAVNTVEKDSKAKRGLVILGALVGFFVFWFAVTSFMTGFVGGLAGTSSNPVLQVIAAGVFVAPFAHVLFARLVDYVIEQCTE